MYAIEAIFSRTQYVNGRAEFLRLEVIAISANVDSRLRRNKHCALFSTKELAKRLMETCDPHIHTLAYRVRNRLFIAFDATTVAKAINGKEKS